MALTASITTSDGVTHTNAHALVYPLQIQTVAGDQEIRLTLHCWHDEAAKTAGRGELEGYPTEVRLNGEAAMAAIVAGMAPLAEIAWTGNPLADAALAEAAIIGAMESVVMAERPEFSRLG